MNLIFLDTETTGLDNARIVQLAYKIRNSDEMFIEYYKPPVPIEFGAMGTHHITEEMVADKLPFSETTTYKELPQILKDSVFVAHNAKYDIHMLRYHFNLSFDKAFAENRLHDTMVLHYMLDERQGTHGLKQLALKYHQNNLHLYKYQSHMCEIMKFLVHAPF
jgi:DNA polymerase III epsilon subunit-like protein